MSMTIMYCAICMCWDVEEMGARYAKLGVIEVRRRVVSKTTDCQIVIWVNSALVLW